MWTKVQNKAKGGKAHRVTPAVQKRASGFSAAALVIPGDMATGDRVDIYRDGDRIGFVIGATGDYAVQRRSPKHATRSITIPHALTARIPAGTTDVSLTPINGMLVLDLATIAA